MAFPISPTVGQNHIEGGRAYRWSGYAWDLAESQSVATGHASQHAANGSDPLTLTAAQVSDFSSAVAAAAPSQSGYRHVLLFG